MQFWACPVPPIHRPFTARFVRSLGSIIPSLTTLPGVKQIWATRGHRREQLRHFALEDWFCRPRLVFFNPAADPQVSPPISSVLAPMIVASNSPPRVERQAAHSTRRSTVDHRMTRAHLHTA